MKKKRRQSGFTLVELLVALMITSVVLGAVVTLADATACAKSATDEMGRQQSHLRHMNRRFTRLIQSANAVISISEDAFVLWHDLDTDGLYTGDTDELTTVYRGTDGDGLEVVDQEVYDDCSNVEFGYDAASADETRLITIWFDMEENGCTQTYTINARMRGSDAHKQF